MLVELAKPRVTVKGALLMLIPAVLAESPVGRILDALVKDAGVVIDGEYVVKVESPEEKSVIRAARDVLQTSIMDEALRLIASRDDSADAAERLAKARTVLDLLTSLADSPVARGPKAKATTPATAPAAKGGKKGGK